MSTNPIKLFGFIGAAAVIAAGVLSQNIAPQAPPASQPARTSGDKPAAQSSWWQETFGSMEFRRESASAPIAPRVQTAAAAALPPPPRKTMGFGSVALKADPQGHYHARIEIDGQQIPMLVDTGATIVALRHEDAARLGINPMPSDFNVTINTANGQIKAANTHLREMRLENITVSDIPAVILPAGALNQSLLGMSFMKKLSSFEISGGELVLKP